MSTRSFTDRALSASSSGMRSANSFSTSRTSSTVSIPSYPISRTQPQKGCFWSPVMALLQPHGPGQAQDSHGNHQPSKRIAHHLNAKADIDSTCRPESIELKNPIWRTLNQHATRMGRLAASGDRLFPRNSRSSGQREGVSASTDSQSLRVRRLRRWRGRDRSV